MLVEEGGISKEGLVTVWDTVPLELMVVIQVTTGLLVALVTAIMVMECLSHNMMHILRVRLAMQDGQALVQAIEIMTVPITAGATSTVKKV